MSLTTMDSSTRPWLLGWWFALISLALAFGLMLWLYWSSVLALTRIWNSSDTFQHGWVILPLSVYLAWTQRGRLKALSPQPSMLGVIIILLLGLIWLLARTVDIVVMQTFVVVAMVPAIVVTVLGLRISKVLVFPLAYLFFAWPVGSFLIPVLMDFTAWFSVVMLRLSGLPVFMEGRYISIPAGDFVVAEVCSGIRYLIASVALGLVFGYLVYRSVWRFCAFMILAVTLPIIANGLRAYGIIMIAHWTDMEHAVGVDHLIYGWLFFGVVIFVLFFIGTLFRDDHYPQPVSSPPSYWACQSRSHSTVIVTLPLALFVLVLPAVTDTWLAQRAERIATGQIPSAATVPGWQGPQVADLDWQPQFNAPDFSQKFVYKRDQRTVALYLWHYRNDRQGAKMITHGNRIADGEKWRRLNETMQKVMFANGLELTVHETHIRDQRGGQRIVWHWYQVANKTTAQPVLAKLLEVWAQIKGDGNGAMLVAVSTHVIGSVDQARQQLAEFLNEHPSTLNFK